ncbi:hypothetical protein DPMN_115281 [Dreissena polymorpha]|uniref:Ubiquitin-like protease family profile domain-containing protein n=2 Tax=Dreissena polymorpha TaxID=45954 RepID=A0A9D4QSB6_DREPO|nr:hypothetical protein DPMN_115281 [Dreissena polymorpha]
MAAAMMVPFSHLLQVYVTTCLKFNIDTRQFMCQRAQIVKDGLEKISSEFKAPPCNKQRHGNSCGVFALMTAKCLVMKKHPTMLRQAHDSVYRD